MLDSGNDQGYQIDLIEFSFRLLFPVVLERHRYADRSRATCVDSPNVAYLAKLLNAADCGFMQSGTRDVFSCSAINLCISSETDNDVPIHERMTGC